MSRQDHIREFAAKALADGRVDYFIGWKQGHNASEVIPAFVKDPAEVEQLVWNPLCHHNLVTFIKRNMPDPADAKIGVCVKGCDSRTLVALLQEELVDKEKLYVVGVPCDGIVDRRKLEKEFADELVDIAFPERARWSSPPERERRKNLPKNDDAARSPAATAATPTPSTRTIPRARWNPSPTASAVKPDWSDISTTRISPTTSSRRCSSASTPPACAASPASTCARCACAGTSA